MLGRSAAKRRSEGGKRAVGRDSLSSDGYALLRRMLLVRSAGNGNPRCEFCGSTTITGEIEHAVARSQGGADSWANCWIPCRSCAKWKEVSASEERGRLRVTPLGDGVFLFEVIHGTKWSGYTILMSSFGGRLPTEDEEKELRKLA